MPNPAWVPIIGNSFSDVGSQIAGWAGFNRGVEENNITRRMAQDEAINRYNANVWNMQRGGEEQARQPDARREHQHWIAQHRHDGSLHHGSTMLR